MSVSFMASLMDIVRPVDKKRVGCYACLVQEGRMYICVCVNSCSCEFRTHSMLRRVCVYVYL